MSGRVWRMVLTFVALAATLAALYLQVFERRARQEESRLAAARLDQALAESRVRLREEILAELRKENDAAESGTQPVPDTVLRRLETGGNGLDVFRPQEALVIAGLDQDLQALERQTEESDRALRRDLDDLRAATQREADVSFKASILMLAALLCLIVQLLASPRAPEKG